MYLDDYDLSWQDYLTSGGFARAQMSADTART
jgi:hypothetical protein